MIGMEQGSSSIQNTNPTACRSTTTIPFLCVLQTVWVSRNHHRNAGVSWQACFVQTYLLLKSQHVVT